MRNHGKTRGTTLGNYNHVTGTTRRRDAVAVPKTVPVEPGDAHGTSKPALTSDDTTSSTIHSTYLLLLFGS
jgi:hypothetical protein